ncbi:MAG: signal peptidase II [Micromonosporaceae bacterium]|nr:signal peptidase II [Micromonosporaceae bacterium]
MDLSVPEAGDPAQAAPAAVPAGAGRRARLLLVGIAAASVLLDQVTKQLTVAQLVDAEPVRLLGGALYLVHTTNSGAAFSLGSSYTWVFPLVAFAVIGWIGWMALRLRSTLWAVALGLVLGGATGNLVDRLAREPGPFRGAVVDMISVFAPDGSVFPVFNLADSSLVMGVLLAVWLELTGRRRDGTRATSRPTQAERGG